MKQRFGIIAPRSGRLFGPILVAVCVSATIRAGHSEPLSPARVTQVIQDVSLLPANAAARRAAINDKVERDVAVRTGGSSRAELTFPDLTITRLGANTVFTLKEGTREVNLLHGSVLLEVPPTAPAATVRTAAVTAAVSGGTAMFGTGPPLKFMVLEGTGTFYPTGHPEEIITLHGGEMVALTADGRITRVGTFDVKTVLQTAQLTSTANFPELTNLPLILNVVDQQITMQATTSGSPPPQKDIVDQTTTADTSNPSVSESPAPSSSGPPTTLTTITSPAPYVIGSGTSITTDPTITTNGVTKYGVIYHGSSVDGQLSTFIFGSDSPFDQTSGFDQQIGKNPGEEAAIFKFTSLQLTGNPTIDSTNGPTDLGLIAINGITSGGPGGTITFTGLKGVLLATQDGSINLGPQISFSGSHDLNIYARGASSDLTLGSSITTDHKVRLFSERNMMLMAGIATDDLLAVSGGDMSINSSAVIHAPTLTLSSGGDLTWSGQTSDETQANSEASVDVLAQRQLTITGDLEIDRHDGGSSLGLNVFLAGGTNFTVGGALTVNVDNANGGDLSDGGGNITLHSGGNLNVNGGSLNLTVSNNGGQIGTGGDISVMTQGDMDLPNGGANFTIHNTSGMIDNGGNIALAVRSISTTGPVQALVENYDFSGNTPGQIGTGGNISITTAADLSAQFLSMLVNNRSGGRIDSPVSLTLNVGGALTTSADSTDVFGFPTSFLLTISTRFDSTTGPALSPRIGGNATDTVTADSASIGGVLGAYVSSTGGTVEGNSLITFNITHDFSVKEEADVEILNDADSGSPLAGSIHGSATVAVSANNFTANALFAFIDNRDAGTINSDATIAFNIKGNFSIPGTNPGYPDYDATVPGEADLYIVNNKRGSSQDSATTGGTIGGDALVALTAGNVSTAGYLDMEIVNLNHGTIGGNATVNLSVPGSISASDLYVAILNQNGGSVDGNATVDITTGGSATSNSGNLLAGSLFVQINNYNGSIGGNATINMNVGGTATVNGDATVSISGNDPAGSATSANAPAESAAINFNGGSYEVTGTFLSTIDGSGTITFENTDVHGNMLKAGVFGPNGTLRIGGGMLSADTILKLYAPGSNGTLNFVANVTLSSGTEMDLAAKTITIQPSVVVTIAGSGGPANIYTDNPNYSGPGGNNPSNGSFGGNGANSPQPLASAPPFYTSTTSTSKIGSSAASMAPKTATAANVVHSGGVTSARHQPASRTQALSASENRSARVATANAQVKTPMMNVGSSGELLSLLDSAVPDSSGKVRVAVPKQPTHSANSSELTDTGQRRNDQRLVMMKSAATSAENRQPFGAGMGLH